MTNISLANGTAKYALYPVWMLTTQWNGQTYTFAMNGQTGKEEDGKILCKMGDQGEIDGEEIDPWQVVGPDENGMLTFGMMGFVKE